ncbi:MAG: hypothetical protein JNM70_02755 [Anaerolineae bacterium]|jgi:hypothetical protein|nr:hypothetical protein [Anaerolineae bacterium]
MPEAAPNAAPAPASRPEEGGSKSRDPQELARKVAERVWQMWREEMRRQNERRPGGRRS